MGRFNFKESIPSRSIVTDRIPKPSAETRLKASVYSKLALSAFVLVAGATLTLSGLVLIPMMAFAYEMLAVVGAAAMVTTGVALAGASYLWITGPA
jgi:hypothetical protein